MGMKNVVRGAVQSLQGSNVLAGEVVGGILRPDDL